MISSASSMFVETTGSPVIASPTGPGRPPSLSGG